MDSHQLTQLADEIGPTINRLIPPGVKFLLVVWTEADPEAGFATNADPAELRAKGAYLRASTTWVIGSDGCDPIRGSSLHRPGVPAPCKACALKLEFMDAPACTVHMRPARTLSCAFCREPLRGDMGCTCTDEGKVQR